MEDRGTSLIACNKVCQPKDNCGLRILDIPTHNKCLLMKHLDKFSNHVDIPWVKLIWEAYYSNRSVTDRPYGSFWWKSITKLIPEFKQVAKVAVGKGHTALFWQDNWNSGKLKE